MLRFAGAQAHLRYIMRLCSSALTSSCRITGPVTARARAAHPVTTPVNRRCDVPRRSSRLSSRSLRASEAKS